MVRSHDRDRAAEKPRALQVQRDAEALGSLLQAAGHGKRNALDRASLLTLQRLFGNGAVASLVADPPRVDDRPGRYDGQMLDVARAVAAPQVADVATHDGVDDTSAEALTTYTGSNFVGETVTADPDFVGSLDSVNAYAVANAVDVYVTDSYRQPGGKLSGAVVEPATMSNHHVGHAIDMNVKYGKDKSVMCNSKGLGGTLPDGVKGFIDSIRADAGLRWGGEFSKSDPVHIDDGLNLANPESYKKKLAARQSTRAPAAE